jgi:hypothetical protein
MEISDHNPYLWRKNKTIWDGRHESVRTERCRVDVKAEKDDDQKQQGTLKRRSVFVERIGSRSREDQVYTKKEKVVKKCCFMEVKYNRILGTRQ